MPERDTAMSNCYFQAFLHYKDSLVAVSFMNFLHFSTFEFLVSFDFPIFKIERLTL